MKYAGIRVTKDRISHRQGKGPLAGARARVESAGEIDRRLSATRLVLTGGFGLFWKKKVDSRQVFLTVEGDGFSIVEEVGPKEQKAARKFAAKLTSMGMQAEREQRQEAAQPTAPPPPVAAPLPPPPALPPPPDLPPPPPSVGSSF